MPRLSRAELQREIQRELERDPDISTRAIIRRVRERGIRAGTDRLRAITRLARGGVGGLETLDRGLFATQRQFDIAVRETISDYGGGRVLDGQPTHTRISWVAHGRIAVFHYGDLLSIERVTVRGVAIYSLNNYRPELLAARAAHDLAIQAVKQAGNFPDTLIEGIETEIISSDIEIRDADLRGARNRYGTRRT